MNLDYGLQHLDIKPRNLFLIHNHVKVADFGLLKDLGNSKTQVTGGMTPLYCSPETAQGNVSRPIRALDYRDDDNDTSDGSNATYGFSDPARGSFVHISAANIVNGSYVIYQNETYVTVKAPNATFAGDSAAQWAARPSPKPDSPRTGTVSGRGMACVAYEGDNGYVAMVAEVDVDQASGRVKATRFVVAQDCGPISNPDGMRNQIEGGALQGMSRALGEEVTWDDQKVTSVDWRTFHSLPLGFDVPVIESVLVNRTDVEATGAGETAITIVAAAIGNAIFDATGARIRQVPFTAERVKLALDARV
jgi:CO/xanthine dehydrogenase Mo-binding subunit